MEQSLCQTRSDSVRSVLDNKARAELSRLCFRKIIPAHRPIFNDGEIVKSYYQINSGIVKLVKTMADGRVRIVGLLYPSFFVGQSLNRRHSYAAESATEVDLWVYPKGPFERFLKTHPELERQILYAKMCELDLFREGMLLLGRRCSYERVAGLLFMMAGQARKIGVLPKNDVHFELPLTRTEMADYLGLTLETVCRKLSRLKKKHVITLPSSRDIVVPDLEFLRREAQFERCSGDFGESPIRAVA